MRTRLTRTLVHLADVADRVGLPWVGDKFDNWHGIVGYTKPMFWYHIREHISTFLWRVATWFEDHSLPSVSRKIDDLRWWCEGMEPAPVWLSAPWLWYTRSRMVVFLAGPMLLLFLLVFSIYLMLVRLALDHLIQEVGPGWTLVSLAVISSAGWWTFGYVCGRRSKQL